MSIEIRTVTPEEMPEFQAVSTYVFADNRPVDEINSNLSVQAEWTHALFVDGVIAATLAAYPFIVRLNGSAVPMAGVTSVGTYPEFRRRGFLRHLMQQAIHDERERGQAVAILWASYGAIYQRFGYGLASQSHGWDVEPRNIAFNPAAPTAGGRIRVMRKDEARPVIEALYKQFSRPRNLMILRAPQLWDARLRDEKLRFGVYYDTSGEPRGYLVFMVREREFDQPGQAFVIEPGPNQYMYIRDAIALDADAERGLWDFVASHDLVARARWWNAAPDSPAPYMLLEPRDLREVRADGIWMRINDVEAALPLRPYGDEGALTLRVVEDDIADWNNGSYRLETNGPESTVTRTTESPDLTMRPAQLAVLLAGSAPATQLARAGLIEAEDEAVLKRADRIFATDYAPWCPDGFESGDGTLKRRAAVRQARRCCVTSWLRPRRG